MSTDVKDSEVKLSSDKNSPIKLRNRKKASTDVISPRKCDLCLQSGPSKEYKCCKKCFLTVHSTCLPSIFSLDEKPWLCEWCKNFAKRANSNNHTCILCRINEPKSAPKAILPTAMHNWAHLICAVFLPSAKFTQNNVRGISELDQSNWDEICQVCRGGFGYKIKCNSCDHLAHASCSQTNRKYFLGFKLIEKKKEGEKKEKVLIPILLCPKHSKLDMTHDIYTLFDKNEEENKTMINLFFEINTIEPTNEMVLSPLKLNYENNSNLVKKECYKCDATVSLSWWEISESLIANNDKDKVIECLTVDKLNFYEGASSKNPYLLCHTCRWFLVETKQ